MNFEPSRKTALKKLNKSPFIVKIVELIHQGGNTSPRNT